MLEKFKENTESRINRLDSNVEYICKVDNFDGIKYILEKLTSEDSEEYLEYIFKNYYRSKFDDDLNEYLEWKKKYELNKSLKN